jgi:hypothetical protein
MDRCDVSVILPTIRTHLLNGFYDSLAKSISRHSFEVVFCGPFNIPPELAAKPNVKHINDYGSPTRAAQLAAKYSTGRLIYHTVDDVLFYPNRLSDAVDFYLQNRPEALGIKYIECPVFFPAFRDGIDMVPQPPPDHYWYANFAYPGWPQIKPEWGICIHFLMSRPLFMELGGFDCHFEYLNHATHDLLFRMQRMEAAYPLYPENVTVADHTPNITGDHAPIHWGQTSDEVKFREMWLTGQRQDFIDFNNYLMSPEVWSRRFKKKVESYEELGYSK